MEYLNEIEEHTQLVKCEEMIKTRSGEWYSLSKKDMIILINDVAEIMRNHITEGDIVGLFLDFDNANLNSIILYHACILCGGTVIRCGISDIDRQLPISCDISLDILICTAQELRYIEKRVKYRKHYIVNSIENIEHQLPLVEASVFELFDIPGLLIFDHGAIVCPGYDIIEYNAVEGTICLKSKNSIRSFCIEKYFINVPMVCGMCDVSARNAVMSFISMQIELRLFTVLNGKIDDAGNITLDSIGMVELLVRIEEEFCISIPLEKVSNYSFTNVKHLAELILSTLQENKK